MLVWIVFALGCAVGWYRAARRGGGLTHRLQFALAHGIPAGLLALAGVVIAMRQGWLG
jgi:hypothetical protein